MPYAMSAAGAACEHDGRARHVNAMRAPCECDAHGV